jgi:hypothetical protein
MAIWKNLTVLCLAAGVSLWLAGCNPTNPPSSTGGSGTTDGHDHGHEGHDHAHDHAHHGPHGGDLMAIGDEEYHAEWTHDEEGKITFYILDAEAKKEVPIAAEKITIDVQIGENDPVTYELLAVNPSGDDMKTAQFEITDKELLAVIEGLTAEAKGVVATLNVVINDTPFSQKIEKEDHDHGHDHAHGDEKHGHEK